MKLIAGVDEVGRGPLAGPVVAAAVLFKEGYANPEVDDSKKLSAQKREQLVEIIKSECVRWAIVAVGPRRIEQLNIREASRLAMSMALSRIGRADLVLVDGNMPIISAFPQRTVIGGDALHKEIGAASILAKVWRDQLMCELDEKYPGFGFSKNAGYPTALHRRAVEALGPSRIHRRTFSGVTEFIGRKYRGSKLQQAAWSTG